MKKIIAVYKNGFTYKPLKSEIVSVSGDVNKFIWKENLRRLRAGKGTFLNRALKLK